jgi:hypothetical protein
LNETVASTLPQKYRQISITTPQSPFFKNMYSLR